MKAIWTAILGWLSGLWGETKTLGWKLWEHVVTFCWHVYAVVVGSVVHACYAVAHVCMIPWRGVEWLWGCLKATGRAIKSIWSKK